MNLKNIEICMLVTAISAVGFIIHGINGVMLLLGQGNNLIEVSSIIFMIFNIFAFSSFRPIANINGVYQGKKRFLTTRRLATYVMWAVSAFALGLYLQFNIESSIAIAAMNYAMAFTIMNAFGFGKTRGKFYWCKYV